MLMNNKFAPHSVADDAKFDLPHASAPQVPADDSANDQRKQLWEVIVRMHYLSHELREVPVDFGVSPEFTRLVSTLLSEWAIMAEEAAVQAEARLPVRSGRIDRH
jgi:hypothetical protein